MRFALRVNRIARDVRRHEKDAPCDFHKERDAFFVEYSLLFVGFKANIVEVIVCFRGGR